MITIYSVQWQGDIPVHQRCPALTGLGEPLQIEEIKFPSSAGISFGNACFVHLTVFIRAVCERNFSMFDEVFPSNVRYNYLISNNKNILFWQKFIPKKEAVI